MAPVPGTAAPGRLVLLDVLRAVAVLLVIAHHIPHDEHLRSWDTPLLAAWTGLQSAGWVGVDLFFVLSGFLVSGLLFRELSTTGRFDAGRFLIRRGLKIWPAFYVFLGATVLGIVFVKHDTVHVRPLLGELLYLQNYLGGLWAHTWSLAVEEHFYLLLPLLLWLTSRRAGGGQRVFLAVVVGLIVVCPLLRLLQAGTRSELDLLTHIYPTHLRIDGLAWGVLASWLYHFRPGPLFRLGRTGRRALVACGVLMLLPLCVIDRFLWPVYTLGLSWISLACTLIVVAAVQSEPAPRGRGLVRGLAWIGGQSYSIYLWHFSAIVMLTGPTRGMPVALRALSLAAAGIAVGVAAARIVELPVLRLRDRLFPSRARALDVRLGVTSPDAGGTAPSGSRA